MVNWPDVRGAAAAKLTSTSKQQPTGGSFTVNGVRGREGLAVRPYTSVRASRFFHSLRQRPEGNW
jgi:hypothetical protein